MKNLKFISFFLLALTLGLVVACKEENDLVEVQLEVNPTELSFSAYDEPKTVVVSSNYEWSAELQDAQAAEWCTLTRNADTLLVAVSANNDTRVERSTAIVVSSGDKQVLVAVSQAKAEAAQIVLNPRELRLECEGQVPSQVKVITTVQPITVAWPEEGKPEWMNEPVLSGDTLTFTALDNPTKVERSAKIAVTVGPEGNQATDTLTLVQAANAPYIKIMPDTVRLDYQGTPVTVDVYYNATLDDEGFFGYSWNKPFYEAELVPELSQVRSENMKARKNTYKVWAPMNTSIEPRIVETSFFATLDGGTPDEVFISAPVCIIQEGTPKASISASETNMLFAASGSTQTITVTSSLNDWQASADQDWIKVKVDGNKLNVTVEKYTGSAERKGTISVSCGSGSNTTATQITVTQAGTSSDITLSTKSIGLTSEGTAQTVKVVTGLEDWWVEGAPEWLHAQADVAKGEIVLTADPAEASRTATLKVVGTKDGKRIEATLEVEQLKKYQIGEVYKINGNPVGIVFYTSDNGNHGYVFSMDDNGLSEDSNNALHWSLDMYAGGIPGEDEALKQSEPVCLDQNDGRNNMAAVKKCTNPFMNGRTWQECYPVMAWADKYAQNHPEQEWYLPSRNELDKLTAYLNGIYEGSGVTTDPADADKREAARNAVNKLLTDNGGTPFYWDTDYDQGIYLNGITMLISSTEVVKDESGLGYVGVYLVKPLHYATTGVFVTHARGDATDPNEATVTSVRMMFRF